VVTTLPRGVRGPGFFHQLRNAMTVIGSSRDALCGAQFSRVGESIQAKIQVAIAFVEEHLSERISLHNLADEVGASPFHFARVFKRTTGLTLHQYVVSRRIERARQLLQDGELSIATIAVDTGFASQSHLTEVFRRELGVTPGVYQARTP
jgi:AraC family transcriptional regulator